MSIMHGVILGIPDIYGTPPAMRAVVSLAADPGSVSIRLVAEPALRLSPVQAKQLADLLLACIDHLGAPAQEQLLEYENAPVFDMDGKRIR